MPKRDRSNNRNDSPSFQDSSPSSKSCSSSEPLSNRPSAKRQRRARRVPDPTTLGPYNAPGGDIVLVLGNEIRFQVHSHILKAASPVFAAMLGPIAPQIIKLEDGQRDPKEYHWQAEDPQALSVVFRVLHLAHEDIFSLPPSLALSVAMLVDKYDMVPQFTFAAHYWIQFRPSKLPSPIPERARCCWELTLAAYWFQHKHSFFKYSARLVKTNMDSYHGFVQEMTESNHHALGFKLCLAIEESRVRVFKSDGSKPGICLHCFRTTKGAFKNKQSDCKSSQYH
ncbi:Fc.00g071790.m01.CDS01 [Cosmosporella sp. VM-42]